MKDTQMETFREMIKSLDDDKLNALETALGNALEVIQCLDDNTWRRAYARYNAVYNEVHERYVEENIGEFREYQKRYLERVALGIATPEEGDFYSDWHKDIYGVRPHRG